MTIIFPLTVELDMAGTWVDISSRVRHEQGIRIMRGRSTEATRVDPARCELTVDNRDGALSPRNPTGPYYELIGRNTPIRVSVDAGDSYLNITDTVDDRASTPDNAALDITGDIDLRVEARLDDWATETATALLGKYSTTGNQRSYRLEIQNGLLFLGWSTTGTDILQRASTQVFVTPPSRRLAVRATLDVNNGAAGHTVTFYTAESMAGPWTQLGDPVVTAGTTSVFSSTAPLDVGKIQTLSSVAPVGEVLKAEVRSGLDGTVVANPDFTAQSAGGTSFADAAGRTWTVANGATISNRRVRFAGEVSEWPPSWGTGGFDVVNNLQASGLLRRSGQANAPLQSTLRRRIPTGSPKAYWPLEDGTSTTRPQSPIAKVKPLTVSGLTFAADDTLGGSAALPTLGDASTIAGAVPGAATGGWHLEMVYKVDTLWTTEHPVMTLYLSGAGASVVAVHVRAWTGGIRVQALDEDSTVVATNLTTDAEAIADFAGTWNRLQLFSYDDGPNTHVVAAWRNISANSYWYVSTSYAGAPGKAIRLGANWHADLNGMAVGHLSVFDTGGTSTTSPGVTIYDGADDGFAGESALERMDRMINEGANDGTAMYFYDGDNTTASAQMGPQGVKPYMEVLRDAEATDGGILYERRDKSALVYRDRSGMYNQTPRLILNYTGAYGLITPLESIEDDQNITNDVTVTREGGSSGTAVLTEGALSVLAPPNGIGRVATGETLNLYSDEQAAWTAGWRLHLSTVDEARYPKVAVLLQTEPSSLTETAEVDLGDRIQITNPPAWLPPDDIDLLVQGYTEYLTQNRWELEYNCTPGSAWTVGVVEGNPTHTDTDGSELAEALTTTETDVDVQVTDGLVWTTAPPAFHANPRMLTDLTGWTGNNATLARVASPGAPPVVDGQWSMRITPDGVAAAGGANSSRSAAGTATPTTQYTVSCWAYSPLGWSDLRAAIDWHDAADVYISSSIGSATVVAANTWTFLSQTFTAPASTSRVVARARHGGTPAATDVWYATQLTVRQTATRSTPSDFPLDVRAGGELMRVEAIGPSVLDAFGRTASSGWGSADSGQAYSTSGGSASDYSVSGGVGRQSHSATNTPHNAVIAQVVADFDVVASMAAPVLATGASLFGFVLARYVSSTDAYYARLEWTTAAAVIVSIRKRVANVDTQLATFTTSLTHVAGTMYRVRFQGEGSSLRARAWLASGTEPTAWQVTATDTAFTAAGSVGIRTHVGTGNTNTLPLVITADDFESLNPQTFTVTRSVNGVVKTHAAGADIRLDMPAIVAL